MTGYVGDIEERKRLAWDTIRRALDEGQACFGWNLDDSLEYAVINGYDDTGYHYDGVVNSRQRGTTDWRQLNWLEMYIVSRGMPADDRTVVRGALEFALELTREPTKWSSFDERKTGLAGYDNWLTALANTPASDLSGHGVAYNLAVWNECRAYAVKFLEEAARRLTPLAQAEFADAIGQFRDVAAAMTAAREIFPWAPGSWNTWARDSQLIAKLIPHIADARNAEQHGLEAFSRIVAEIATSD